MTDEPLVRRVRSLWVELAGAPAGFGGVAVSPRSLLCPPGWVGLVDLGSAMIATAPDDRTAELLRHALSTSDFLAHLPVVETLGPATLSYCDAERFRPVPSGGSTTGGGGSEGAGSAGATAGLEADDADAAPAGDRSAPAGAGRDRVEALPAADPEVGALRAGVSAADDGEAALDEITSRAFVVRGKAAAGYQVWPRRTAHLSVLTATEWRGQGLARLVASAATADALAHGLLPQWRARPEASRRVARALGFREFGTQLSIRLGEGHS